MGNSASNLFGLLDPSIPFRSILSQCGRHQLSGDEEGVATIKEATLNTLTSLVAGGASGSSELTISKDPQSSTLKDVAAQLSSEQVSRFVDEMFDNLVPHFAALASDPASADQSSWAARQMFKIFSSIVKPDTLLDGLVGSADLTWTDDHNLDVKPVTTVLRVR